ncbi:sugar phosphate nucleotidyltransferase [Bdellovibrio sp. HCB290]|uniref:sugar phosphate nucleotidyltransferase n=1 Tax=Bdellovibrio sp. HCB290 TaxID=3394356 RepID=UPI0039B413A9
MGTTELETKTLVLLAGGKASRLNDFLKTDDQVKCLSRFGDMVFIDYLLSQAIEAGINHVIVLAGPALESISAHIKQSSYPIRFSFPKEETRLGTGGALSLIAPFLDESRFILSNADTFFDENPFLFFQERLLGTNSVFLLSSRASHSNAQLLQAAKTMHWPDLYNTDEFSYTGIALLNSDVFLNWKSLGLPECCSFEKDVFPKIKNAAEFYSANFAEIDFGTEDGFRRLQSILMREVV